jgi:hypothetical protein
MTDLFFAHYLTYLFKTMHQLKRTRAQESREAIQRLYIAMRHLFIRGSYKPLGVSGEAMIEALQDLQPEIYGSINDPEKVELDGLLYVFERLPQGIEMCRYIRLISREGYEHSGFDPIIPAKRRRNCYRIDKEQMFVEMTRGRSDVYDILTHLTFMYIEAEKIRRNSLNHRGHSKREWLRLEEIVLNEEEKEEGFDKKVAYTYLSTLLGRTYNDTVDACERFAKSPKVNSIFDVAYWLGQLSLEEARDKNDREISFSSALKEKIGHHVYGELWAQNIKSKLQDEGLLDRPIHIISANLHSVMNSLYGMAALEGHKRNITLAALTKELSTNTDGPLSKKIKRHALKNGMFQLDDTSGTNISIQIFDTEKLKNSTLPPEIQLDIAYVEQEKPVIIVMDYAFGEQAFETMDELLKPYDYQEQKIAINVASVSIMGKAGILKGDKGDIMIPNAHVLEGIADNYPFKNDFTKEDFEGNGLNIVSDGPMITVLGTSLQNRDVLNYFLKSSWKAIGLEMEGAHYQKAIQAASKIRNSVSPNLVLRYAYYASDNPLETGNTLASGSLGGDGVKPTYLITQKILNGILNPS